jgi:hypothetical protein
LYPVVYVTEIQSVLEPSSEVATVFCNLSHSSELSLVTSSQIQKGQFVELPKLLVGHFNNLVVAVGKRFSCQP